MSIEGRNNVPLKSPKVEQITKVDILCLSVITMSVYDGVCTKVIPAKTGHQKCSEQHNKQELTGRTGERKGWSEVEVGGGGCGVGYVARESHTIPDMLIRW